MKGGNRHPLFERTVKNEGWQSPPALMSGNHIKMKGGNRHPLFERTIKK